MLEFFTKLLALPHYKLLSFAIAVGAWLYVQGGETIEESYRVSLAWKLPPGLVTTEPLPASILTRFSGSRSAMRRAQDADLMMAIDLSDAPIGAAELAFDEFKITGMPQNVSLVEHSPAMMQLVLDESDRRKVKLRPEMVGDPGAGYAVMSVEVDPNVVEITGPRVVVEELRELSTKPIDVSGLTGDVRVKVEVALPRSVELAGGADAPTAIIELAATVQRKKVEDVAVVVPRMPGWSSSSPAISVVLEGPASAIEKVKPADLLAVVHLPAEPDKPRYDASFGPREGIRLSVPVGVPDVRVVATEPPSIEVRAP